MLSVKLRSASDRATGKVEAVEVLGVSPWANSELGQWLGAQAKTGDAPTMGWACGRYWEVACQRARHWLRCRRAFASLLPAAEPENDDRRHGTTTAIEHGDKDDSTPVRLGDLSSAIGSRALLLSQARVSLLLTWDIVLDRCGEVMSEADVAVCHPKIWQNVDDRGSLKRFKELFQRVLERDGITEATRVVVQLLFPC